MIRDTEIDTTPPPRDAVHRRGHLYSGVLLLLVLAVLELTIGSTLHERDRNSTSDATHWSRLTQQVSAQAPEKEQQAV